jgi:hypothetical protein
MQTNVKTHLTSFLRNSTTSPVTVKGSRKKYATASQIASHASRNGFATTAGWVGRTLHAMVADNKISMTTTVIDGRKVNVYGLK